MTRSSVSQSKSTLAACSWTSLTSSSLIGSSMRSGVFIIWEIAIGLPHVACLERITRRAEVDYAHKKQTGSSREFARNQTRCESRSGEYGHSLMSIRADSILLADFIDGVERGVRSSMAAGASPAARSSASGSCWSMARITTSIPRSSLSKPLPQAAVREARRQGEPELLQPVMRVEIVTPQDHLPAIITT